MCNEKGLEMHHLLKSHQITLLTLSQLKGWQKREDLRPDGTKYARFPAHWLNDFPPIFNQYCTGTNKQGSCNDE